MFDKEFFPTPVEVIKKMLEPYEKSYQRMAGFSSYTEEGYAKLHGLHILEPSAGKGDILDFITNNCKSRDVELYAIEQNPELKMILQEKNYHIIGDDFFGYHGDTWFDLIIMNPPFSNGVDHLLHAFDIARDTDIICLLNAETILNPYTDKRKLLLSIIEEHGEYEILGDVFKDAERTTDVNVALVRLHKEAAENPFDFQFKNVKSDDIPDLDESIFENQVLVKDVIGNMMLQYEELKKFYVDFRKSLAGISFYGNDLTGQYKSPGEMAWDSASLSRKAGFNKFTKEIKHEMWQIVFKKTNIEKYMTHKVRENFHEFSKQQGYMDFNRENVIALIEMIVSNRGNILEQAIVDVFEIFTKYHEENRCHVEGWKTNDAYKVNQKVIMPYWVKYGEYRSSYDLKEYGDKFSHNYSRESEYSDIDKVMCYITGEKFEEIISIRRAMKEHFDIIGTIKTGDQYDSTCESTFFKIKFFKKGTVHITFKDRFLWEQFNLRAARGKNWLPESKYSDIKANKETNTNPEPSPGDTLLLEFEV